LTLAFISVLVAVENQFLCIFISLSSFFLSQFFSVVLYYLLSSVCLFYLFFLVHRQVGAFHLQLLNPGRIPKPPEVGKMSLWTRSRQSRTHSRKSRKSKSRLRCPDLKWRSAGDTSRKRGLILFFFFKNIYFWKSVMLWWSPPCH
jgi:hypothetical protein